MCGVRWDAVSALVPADDDSGDRRNGDENESDGAGDQEHVSVHALAETPAISTLVCTSDNHIQASR